MIWSLNERIFRKKEPEIKQETLEEKRKDIHQDIQPIVVHSAEVTFRQPFEDLIEADPRQTTPVASDEVDGLSEGIRVGITIFIKMSSSHIM